MMNKSGSRLVAMLLALMMILNIAPVSAFAQEDPVGSNYVAGPEAGTVPNKEVSSFTIQYVIKGQYTYNGVDTVLSDYTKTNQSGNPSTVQPGSVTGCSVDGNTRGWDGKTKTLTFFPVPNTATVELRYELVFENSDGSLGIRTFQIMQNAEGSLIWEKHNDGTQDVKESLEFKEFLKAIYGQESGDFYTLGQINGVDIKQILPFVLPKQYTTGVNNFVVTSSFSDNSPGREFTISYMGHDNGQGLEGNINISDINSQPFTWNGQSKVCLYYRLKAADDSGANYYTITWMNGDTKIGETKVREGATPVFYGSAPTKADDDKYTYTFNGWDPEIVAATGDTTYTAQYTFAEKTVLANQSNTYTIRFVDKDTEEDIADPVTDKAFEQWNELTAVVNPIDYPIDNYEYDGNIYSSIQIGQSNLTDNTVILKYKKAAKKTYTIRFVDKDTGEDIADPVTDVTFEQWGEPTAVVNPKDYPIDNYEYDGNIYTPIQIGQSKLTDDTVIIRYKKAAKIEITVTYVLDNESVKPSGYTVPTDSNKYKEGDTVTVAEKPDYPGYKFTGWKYGEEEITSMIVPSGLNQNNPSIVLRGQFEELGANVWFKIANGDEQKGHTAGTEHYWGWAVTDNEKLQAGSTVSAYSGYAFDRWTIQVGNNPEQELSNNPTAKDVHIVPQLTDDTAANQGFWTDRTYIAHFKTNSYTITWLNDDDTLIDTTTVGYGVVPTHADATKEATAEYTYTFAGWTPEVVAVTGNATYKATFTATKNSYTITWLNDDDTVIDTTSVEYGVVPTHADATKEATAEYTYTFAGWTPEVAAVTGDATYKATFTAAKNSYTITWLNENGTLIDTTTVAYGDTPTHADPSKSEDAQYTYTFAGWTPTIEEVTGEATYQATFTPNLRSYTITWLDENGTLIDTTTVAYGDTPTHADPSKSEDAQYTYAFAGWTPTIEEVTGEATYQATFTPNLRSYTITFENEDHTVLQSGEVAYGETPEYNGATPTKAATAQYTYTFAGWSPAIAEVTGEATYTATYSSAVNEYSYTIHHYLLGSDKSVKDDQTGIVDYGTEIEVLKATNYRNTDLRVNTTDPTQKITVHEGDNTITIFYTLPLTITPNSNSKTYGADEPELTATVVGLLEGESVDYSVSREEGENAGTYVMSVSSDAAQDYYTISYINEIEGEDILFTINPASVTLTANSATEAFTYDGTTKSVDGFTSSVDGLSFSGVSASGEGVNAGDYSVTFEGATVGTTRDTTNNYVVTSLVPGSFTINPASVTLTANSATEAFTYDGTTKSVEGFTSSVDGLSFSGVSASGEGVNAGDYSVTFEGATVGTTRDTTNNYVVTSLVPGSFTINPASVTLTANSATEAFTYDGTTKSVEGFTSSVDGLSFSGVTASGEGVNAGVYTDEVIFNGAEVGVTRDTTNNYVVTSLVPGSFTIDPAAMTVESAGYSGTYDGTAHSVTVTPSITAGTTVEYQLIVAEGEEAWSTTVPSIKDVGSASYNVKVTNPNYEDVTFTVDLSVEAKAVTIAAQPEGKTYGDDDPEQFKKALIGTYFNGELDDIDLTVTRPGAGELANEQAGIHKDALTTGLDAEELNAKYKNYSFTVEDADFTINKKAVTITADSISKPWGYNDPEEFYATVTEGNLIGDDTISYKVTRATGERATGDATDEATSNAGGKEVIGVGEYPISVTLTDEPKNYDVTLKEGKLTIIKTPVTIESSIADLETVYSGTIVELTAQMVGLNEYGDNYNYQWQIGDSEEGPFVDITGDENANKRTYKYILNKHTAGKHYRVNVTINYDKINK